MKDWRGTEIEVGKPVLTHSKNWNHGLGVVSKVTHNRVTVALEEHDMCYSKDRKFLVTLPESLTVLTEDMVEMIIR